MIEVLGATMEAGQIDRSKVRAVTMACNWAEGLSQGELASDVDIAAREKFCKTNVAMRLPMAQEVPVAMFFSG